MKICSKCGYENHEIAKICNKCNFRLDGDIEQDLLAEDLEKMTAKKNKSGALLEGLGLAILVVGLMVSMIAGFGYGEYSAGAGWFIFIVCSFASVLSFAVLKGFAEVIYLLQQLNNKKS